MTRNQVTEVTFLARIPALPDHVKKPAGRELVSGRGTSYLAPPGQIRASGTTALGSCQQS